MGFSCFKKPAVEEDFAPVGAAPATGNGNGLADISPPLKVGGSGKLSSPRSSKRNSRDLEVDALSSYSSIAAKASGGGGAWHAVPDPVKWTGPPVPSSGPSEAEEPYMTAEAKVMFKGCPLMPWEGTTWSGPQILQIIHAGLKDLKTDPKQNRPDTHKMPLAQQMAHMRRACADILPTPLFHFLLKVFEGPDTDPRTACDRFLARILKGCKDTVYCSIAHPIPQVGLIGKRNKGRGGGRPIDSEMDGTMTTLGLHAVVCYNLPRHRTRSLAFGILAFEVSFVCVAVCDSSCTRSRRWDP